MTSVSTGVSSTLLVALVGAVVAGTIAAAYRMWLDARGERRDLRAAIEVMRADLVKVISILRAHEGRDWLWERRDSNPRPPA